MKLKSTKKIKNILIKAPIGDQNNNGHYDDQSSMKVSQIACDTTIMIVWHLNGYSLGVHLL